MHHATLNKKLFGISTKVDKNDILKFTQNGRIAKILYCSVLQRQNIGGIHSSGQPENLLRVVLYCNRNGMIDLQIFNGFLLKVDNCGPCCEVVAAAFSKAL